MTFWCAITTDTHVLFAADRRFTGDYGPFLETKIHRVGSSLVMSGCGPQVMFLALALAGPHYLGSIAQQDTDAEVRAELDRVTAMIAAEHAFFSAAVRDGTPINGRIFPPGSDTETMLVVAGLDGHGTPFIARADSPDFSFRLHGPWHIATAPSRIGLTGAVYPIQPRAHGIDVESRRLVDLVRQAAAANPAQVSASGDLWVIGPDGIATHEFDDAGELRAAAGDDAIESASSP